MGEIVEGEIVEGVALFNDGDDFIVDVVAAAAVVVVLVGVPWTSLMVAVALEIDALVVAVDEDIND